MYHYILKAKVDKYIPNPKTPHDSPRRELPAETSKVDKYISNQKLRCRQILPSLALQRKPPNAKAPHNSPRRELPAETSKVDEYISNQKM